MMRMRECPASGCGQSLSQTVQRVRKDQRGAGVPLSQDRPFLSRAEVAALFGVSSSTVARWARDGRLPFVRTLGGQRRFPRVPIMELAREVPTSRTAREPRDGSRVPSGAPGPEAPVDAPNGSEGGDDG